MIKDVPEIEEKIKKGSLSLSNIAQAESFFKRESKETKESFTLEQKKKVLKELENQSLRQAERILLKKSSNPAQVQEKTRQVTEQLTELKILLDENAMEKLNRLRGLLAHKKPGASYGEIICEALDLAIGKLEPKKPKAKDFVKASFSATKGIVRQQSPRGVTLSSKIKPYEDFTKVSSVPLSKGLGGPNSKNKKALSSSPKGIKPQQSKKRVALSSAVKKIVWQRDGGLCVKCGSQHALEYDHVKPFSFGGSDAPENIFLKCRSCNQRAAIRKLGQEKMSSYL
jgi:hypothetical protein